MDENLDKMGINQKNKKKIKDATTTTNIQILLNIFKDYYANVHQDMSRLANTDGTDRPQLSLDTRQTLGKRPAYEDQKHMETHTHTHHTKKRGRPSTSTFWKQIPLPDAPSRLPRRTHLDQPHQTTPNIPCNPHPQNHPINPTHKASQVLLNWTNGTPPTHNHENSLLLKESKNSSPTST